MKKTGCMLLLLALLFTGENVFSKKISGIDMPDKLTAGDTELILNGAGVREKFFLDLYVGGLYLKNKEKNAAKIMRSKDEMAIRLHIISSLITSKKMKNAVNEGFENSTKNNIIPKGYRPVHKCF